MNVYLSPAGLFMFWEAIWNMVSRADVKRRRSLERGSRVGRIAAHTG